MIELAFIIGVAVGLGLVYGAMWYDYRKHGAPLG